MKLHHTKALFTRIIHTRGIYHQIGLTGQAVRNMRIRMKKGQYPSEQKMKDIIQTAGYTMAIPPVWIHRKNQKKADRTLHKLQHLILDPTFDPDLKELLQHLIDKP